MAQILALLSLLKKLMLKELSSVCSVRFNNFLFCILLILSASGGTLKAKFWSTFFFQIVLLAPLLVTFSVVASVLGYLVISKYLNDLGISEPNVVSTRLVATGLLCIALFIRPSITVLACMFAFGRLSITPLLVGTTPKADSYDRLWHVLRHFRWATFLSQLGTCMWLALASGMYLAHSGAVAGMDLLLTTGRHVGCFCLGLFVLCFFLTCHFHQNTTRSWILPLWILSMLTLSVSLIT